MQFSPWVALIIVGCMMLSACGTTGRTSELDIEVKPSAPSVVVRNVRLASIAMESDAPQLYTANVKPWSSKYTAADLRNLEVSLRRSLATSRLGTDKPPMDLHVVVRRHVVGISNTGGAVLACVAWAITDSAGLAYEEQFYVADSAFLVGTIGGLKDTIHGAIIRRVATLALTMGAQPTASTHPVAKFDKTFTTLDEAAAQLPRQMVSVGNVSLSWPEFLRAHPSRTPFTATKTPWDTNLLSEKFDWSRHLKGLPGR